MAARLLRSQTGQTYLEPLWRTEMKANLNRALQLVVLLATVLAISATTAFCQAPLRTSVGTVTRDALLAQERASSQGVHTAAVDFSRDSEGTRQPPVFHFAEYKSGHTLEDVLPVRTNDTAFVSQSRVPLAHFWGGRLQIAGFASTVKMENVLLGPAAQGALQSLRFAQQARFSSAHSIDLYGVSVGFRWAPPAETADHSIRSFLQSIKE